jgi:aspartate aminotransferase
VDVVDLGAGEPDFGTPEHVKSAAHAALDGNFTKYTPTPGVMELREAVGQRYRLDYGVAIQPEEVIITAGAKQALFNTAFCSSSPATRSSPTRPTGRRLSTRSSWPTPRR